MKATVLDKILLSLLLLVLIASALVAAAAAVGIIGPDMLGDLFEALLNSSPARIIIGAAALVLLVIALRMFIAFLGGKRSDQPKSAIVRVSEFGTSSITLAAIDSMVQRHCLSVANVRACASSIKLDKENRLGIALKLNVDEEANIPELTLGLQSSLKNYVETLSGVGVADISTLVLPNRTERSAAGLQAPQYKR